MRTLKGKYALITSAIAIGFAVFVLYAAAVKAIPFMQHRSLFAIFGVGLALALNSARRSSHSTGTIPWWDLILIALAAVACFNIFFRWRMYVLSYFTIDAPFEHMLGVLLILIVLEAGRRTIGWTFPILTSCFLIYAFIGPWIPGRFGHPGVPWQLLLQNLYQSDVGMWGSITGIAAKTVAVFIVFGAVLQFTGGGQTFMDLATLIAGRMRGGPALTAVVSSAMFGTMSGSTVANVATTGCFTIPMMKRLGYRPEFAGAVEASASTGGQLMPPVMGAAAFIMAEILGISYLSVCLAALIPALLYFLSIFVMVRLEAVKTGLAAIPKSDMPSRRKVLTRNRLAPLFLPMIVLVVLIAFGFTPDRSALYAVLSALILFMFSDFSRSGMKRRGIETVRALEKGGKSLVELVPLIICAQIIVTLVVLTGLGPKLTATIVGLAGGMPWLALLLTAIVCLILGAGIPTTAAYLLVVGTIGSTLIMMGIPALNAHLFIFYFAIISAITPPVCVAAFAAATIAQCSWWKVGWLAMRLASVSYFMAFLFVYRPVFLLQGEALDIVVGFVTACAGIVLLSAGLVGYLQSRLLTVTRILAIVAGAMLFLPGMTTDLCAIALAIVAIVIHYGGPRQAADILTARLGRMGKSH